MPLKDKKSRAAYLRQWAHARTKNGLCRRCIRPSVSGLTMCSIHKDQQEGYQERRKIDPRQSALKKQRELSLRETLRREMFVALGSRCTCCEEWRKPFLTLEHIIPVRNLGKKRLYGAYALTCAKRDGWSKDRYTVLCMNCNWVQRRGSPCPHKTMPIFTETIC